MNEEDLECKSDAGVTLRDSESPVVRQDGQHAKLVRQLKNRHMAMISIGGVIGTGLFVGTAGALRNGGPIGLLLGYIVVGSICWGVMISLGEMVSYLPIPGGHVKLAERFVDPAFSFAMGWNYWYNLTIAFPSEVSAAAILIEYWTNSDELNPLWMTVYLTVVIVINLLGVGAYGEAEFIFASLKVITIVGLLILGIILDLGGGPSGDRIGFRYWVNPGPFAQYDGVPGAKGRFLGWWAVMIQAMFSFVGSETVAMAAGEAKNPRRNVPKAIKKVYIRLLLFYIGGTFVISLLVPSNEPRLNLSGTTAAASPFVIAIQNAGISGLPHVINTALLASVWSAASSCLYTATRSLYGLAAAGNAPKIFLRTTKNGLPLVSIIFCSSFAGFGYMSINNGAGTVFGWFQNMTAIAGLLTWFGICATYIRFYSGLEAQGFDRSKLPFASRLQPFAAWYAAFMSLLICFVSILVLSHWQMVITKSKSQFSGWNVFLKGEWTTDIFITNYLPLVMFPVMYIGYKFWRKTTMVRPQDMDFVSDIAEIEATCYDEPPPKNVIERFWAWLM